MATALAQQQQNNLRQTKSVVKYTRGRRGKTKRSQNTMKRRRHPESVLKDGATSLSPMARGSAHLTLKRMTGSRKSLADLLVLILGLLPFCLRGSTYARLVNGSVCRTPR